MSSRRTTAATTRSWVRPRSARSRLTAPAQRRQVEPELAQVVELRRLALVAERLVVQVLLAATGVAPGGLEVPVGLRGDPHVGPRRRDHEGGDPLHLPRARRPPPAVDVAEPLATEPAEPRLGVRPVAQLHRRRHAARDYPDPCPPIRHGRSVRQSSSDDLSRLDRHLPGQGATGHGAMRPPARVSSTRRQRSSSVIDSTSAANRPEAKAHSAGRPAAMLTSTNSSNARRCGADHPERAVRRPERLVERGEHLGDRAARPSVRASSVEPATAGRRR